MGLIIKDTDFVGDFTIAKTAFTDINSYITKYEEKYLIDLLGVELFKLFKADITTPYSAPNTLIYANLFNEIREDDNSCIRVSEGMKVMLLGFIYFQYQRKNSFFATPSGTVQAQGEVSRNTAADENYLYERYNNSIRSYRTIQWYIRKNDTDYPEYNGQCKAVASWI